MATLGLYFGGDDPSEVGLGLEVFLGLFIAAVSTESLLTDFGHWDFTLYPLGGADPMGVTFWLLSPPLPSLLLMEMCLDLRTGCWGRNWGELAWPLPEDVSVSWQ